MIETIRFHEADNHYTATAILRDDAGYWVAWHSQDINGLFLRGPSEAIMEDVIASAHVLIDPIDDGGPKLVCRLAPGDDPGAVLRTILLKHQAGDLQMMLDALAMAEEL